MVGSNLANTSRRNISGYGRAFKTRRCLLPKNAGTLVKKYYSCSSTNHYDCCTNRFSKDGIFEGFERYRDGENLINDLWSIWSTDDSPIKVSSKRSRSGYNSGLIDASLPGNNQDALLSLGNKTSGKWGLQYWMYIPKGKTCYSNIQGIVPINGGEWLAPMYFSDGPHMEEPNQLVMGTVETAEKTYNMVYPNDKWFKVVMNFDISGGIGSATWQLDIDAKNIIPKNTPLKTTRNATPSSLGGINFCGLPSCSENAEYFIDDIIFQPKFVPALPPNVEP